MNTIGQDLIAELQDITGKSKGIQSDCIFAIKNILDFAHENKLETDFIAQVALSEHMKERGI